MRYYDLKLGDKKVRVVFLRANHEAGEVVLWDCQHSREITIKDAELKPLFRGDA